MATHRFKPEIYHYTFGPHDPQLRVSSGDTVVAETRDAMGRNAEGDLLTDAMKHRPVNTSLKESNPVCGPVYVEDSKEGDILAIHIRKIRLNRPVAYSKQSSLFGSLTGEGPGRSLLYNDPVPTIWFEWKLDLERNVGIFQLPESRMKKIEVPLEPFIGSIGLAPRFGRVEMTLTPGEYGGNMDYRGIREGTTLFLPIWVDGAYLSFGDIHALQGDGEVNGTALETTAEVTLDLEIVKGHRATWPDRRRAEWPRLESDEHITTIGSTRPLMDCVRLAQIELLHWLVDEYGFQREEAWQLMAQVGSMRIGNVVDPMYTVAARFPKKHLE